VYVCWGVTRANVEGGWNVLQIARGLPTNFSGETHRVTHGFVVILPAFIRRFRDAFNSELGLSIEHRVQVSVDLFYLLIPLDLRLEKIHFHNNLFNFLI
jgi:hypothetical protein